jgi:hypothetical protein
MHVDIAGSIHPRKLLLINRGDLDAVNRGQMIESSLGVLSGLL